jgi:hypothetical protein
VRIRLFLINLYLLVQADLAAVDHLDFCASVRDLVLDALVCDQVTGHHYTLLVCVLAVVTTLFKALAIESSAAARRSYLVG